MKVMHHMGFLKKSFLEINGYENIEHYISGDDDLLLQKFSTLLNKKIIFNFNSKSIVKSKYNLIYIFKFN